MMRGIPVLLVFAMGGCAQGPTAVSSGPSRHAAAPTTAARDRPAPSAEDGVSYEAPPSPLRDVLRAPPPPQPYVSPGGESVLLLSIPYFMPLEQVAEPYLKLAGTRVEPRTRRKRDYSAGNGLSRCVREVTLVETATGASTPLALPKGCAEGFTWSADGKRFAFRLAAADSTELWVGDGMSGALHRIDGARVNPMLESSLQWMPDQKTLLVKLVPPQQGLAPAAPLVPRGPKVQESLSGGRESSTYEARDTLKSKHDEDSFEYYSAAQLALIDADSGRIRLIGSPGSYTELAPAPDGEHVLVHRARRPYSYLTTYQRFPQEVEVWNRAGAVVHVVASLPLADQVPIRGVPKGPRQFTWRATEPATLVWAEALDDGDWKAQVPARDKVMMHKAPFHGAPTEVARTEQRFVGLTWGEKPGLALLHERDENRHWTRTFVVDVDTPSKSPRLLWSRSFDDNYGHPGSPVLRVLPNGALVMRQEGTSIYLDGKGASPEGDRPFLDRLDLSTGRTTRIFRSDGAAYERFLEFTDATGRNFLTWHQSPTEHPNLRRRALGAPRKVPPGEAELTSTPHPVTHLQDPTPLVRAIKKRKVTYQRSDGTTLSFILYTPPGYREGTRLPAILNAYPLDYADRSTAGQVTGSDQLFTHLYQYQLLLLAGYAVIDHASFPVVGDPTKAYDTYLDQLVENAKAAIDKAVELGVVDRERVGVTGHSHGALMTVNLLAHTNLFRAGIATSGSYNKTLTPFGFQNERRTVWQAQDVYLKASPFFAADKVKAPLLLVHGDDDANPGTTPLQSAKLFEAIRANGGTTRLVMLPHEPHWYTALESNEHLVAEMLRWFDRYVKQAPAPRGG